LAAGVVFCKTPVGRGISFFQGKGEAKAVGDGILAQRYFSYFPAKICLGWGQEVFVGGEIHSRRGVLKD
jgi:hypothetical protein